MELRYDKYQRLVWLMDFFRKLDVSHFDPSNLTIDIYSKRSGRGENYVRIHFNK